MRLGAVCVRSAESLFVLITLLLFTALPGQASEDNNWEVGAQGGFSFSDGDESFTQYEGLLNYRLPWHWQWDDISVGMRATSTAGVLRGGGESGAIGSLGLAFVLGDGHDFNVRVGSAATLMSEDEYGDEDLGTLFSFTSHLCLSYRFWDALSARVRVQHMSNASLSDENPGVNMFMFGLHYAF